MLLNKELLVDDLILLHGDPMVALWTEPWSQATTEAWTTDMAQRWTADGVGKWIAHLRRARWAADTVRGMLIIAGHYVVDAAQRDAYVEAFRDLVQRARAAPGCLDVAITADALDPGRVNNYERWESEDALVAFRAVADPPELDVEMLDMQMSKFHIDGESDPFD